MTGHTSAYGPRTYWGVLPGPRPDAGAAVRKQDVDASILFLRHALTTGPESRRGIVNRIMLHSVFVQAGLEGIVTCSRCGDRGCGFCRAGVL